MQNFNFLGGQEVGEINFFGPAGRPNLILMLTSAQLGLACLGLSLAKFNHGRTLEGPYLECLNEKCHQQKFFATLGSL